MLEAQVGHDLANVRSRSGNRLQTRIGELASDEAGEIIVRVDRQQGGVWSQTFEEYVG
jgi:hypothetical protein